MYKKQKHTIKFKSLIQHIMKFYFDFFFNRISIGSSNVVVKLTYGSQNKI